jgi:hypothetical protein
VRAGPATPCASATRSPSKDRSAKDGANVGNARVVTMVATGKRLFAASSQTDTPQR